jgi:hypothetical protein
MLYVPVKLLLNIIAAHKHRSCLSSHCQQAQLRQACGGPYMCTKSFPVQLSHLLAIFVFRRVTYVLRFYVLEVLACFFS